MMYLLGKQSTKVRFAVRQRVKLTIKYIDNFRFRNIKKLLEELESIEIDFYYWTEQKIPSIL